jgi:hypothetical protein
MNKATKVGTRSKPVKKASSAAAKPVKKRSKVAEALEFARNRGALSKWGAWGLKYPFGIMKILDWKAVSR